MCLTVKLQFEKKRKQERNATFWVKSAPAKPTHKQPRPQVSDASEESLALVYCDNAAWCWSLDNCKRCTPIVVMARSATLKQNVAKLMLYHATTSSWRSVGTETRYFQRQTQQSVRSLLNDYVSVAEICWPDHLQFYSQILFFALLCNFLQQPIHSSLTLYHVTCDVGTVK